MILTNYYRCAGLEIPDTFPSIVSSIVLIIKIAVPILLVIIGMLDLGKAVVASKEDEIKKGQQLLIKRAVSAILVFFIIQIVQILVRFVANADDDKSTIINCFNCFINNKCGDPIDLND